MSGPPRDKDRIAIELIRSALAGLKFGELVISVHDGEVVQISRTEKFRPPRTDDRTHSSPHSAPTRPREACGALP